MCIRDRLGWVRIDLGIFGELGLLNLIGFFDFYGFELFGWISIDSLGFALTWHDLKGLRWIKRTDIILFCWIWRISLDSCRNGNIFGWVWEDLDGFERL